ncbi:Hypothetical predicted protein [Paramuricea clavata]|uniref:Uncharacterized protein n=1 Tax=Paramuricea clavata TaxID=317549 RepID=A0A6S7H5A0_PARCT|nr:Hypothetical predicted protein [Paramuricea clavata]
MSTGIMTRSASQAEGSFAEFAKMMDEYLKNSSIFKDVIVSAVNTAIDVKIQPLQEEIASLKDEVASLKSKFVIVEAKANENEQYSRRNNIRIFGLPEAKDENCYKIVIDLCKDELKIDVTSDDIDRAHCVRKLKQANALNVGEGQASSQPRAILVKLNGYFTKLKFMRGKRNLSCKRIYINEDLTKINHRLLLNVKELCSPGVKVYSVDGTVVARKHDRVYRIKEKHIHRKVLQLIGVEDPLLSWFESYLSNRKQRVVIDGQYSQWKNINAGIQVVRGRGNARVYPFDEDQKERMHHEMELLALEALEKKTPQFGVKGPSMLSKLGHFDLVHGFVPDFLHCSLLGVTRQLVSLWFDSNNHESPWYIGQPLKQKMYDNHLKDIVVPKEMEELYGVSHCSFNVHQLSHLAKSTQMCGLLWAVSTFVFESNNATLKNMIQGTQYVSDQVCQTYAIMKTLPLFMKQSVQVKAKVRNVSVDESLPLTEAVGGVVNRVVYEYNRFALNGKLYESDKYQRSTKRKNCYVNAKRQGRTLYCKINGLVTVKKCNCDIQHHEQCGCSKANVLACTLLNVLRDRLYKCTLLNITSDFISQVTESPEVVTLDMSEIISKCIKVCHNKKTYLIDMPNMVEME